MTASTDTPIDFSSFKPGIVLHVGLIDHVDTFKDSHVALIKVPKSGRYDHPNTIRLQSKSPIGTVGQEVAALCRCGGYPRTFTRTDKSTGEIIGEVKTADNTFEVIQSRISN